MIMDAEKIADEARNSISRYCIEECRSYCCRKGYLVITSEQADLILQGRRKEFEEKGVMKKIGENKYSLFLGNYDMTCPSLQKDYTCKVHKDPLRPKACQQFPLFLIGQTIRLSPRCPAVKENKLYPYVKQLLSLGYTYAKPNSFFDIELFNVDLKNN